MDKTVNNNNIANPTIDEFNAEKTAENTDKSTKIINMESIRCDNNSAVFQQNEQKSDFDIVDFVISHSDSRSVRKKKQAAKNITLCNIRSYDYRDLCAVCHLVILSKAEPSVWHLDFFR